MSDVATAPAYVTHRIDIGEYHRMAEAGVFDSEKHIELIDGELIERVAPTYPPHAGTVTKITRVWIDALRGRADVRNQVPVTLGTASEPQPRSRHRRPRRARIFSATPDGSRYVSYR